VRNLSCLRDHFVNTNQIHIVGASAAIWITTLILAYYVNDIMDWFKGKEKQNPAASATSRKGIKSVSSSSKTSLLRSGKGVSLAGKGTSSRRGNGPKERTGLQKAGDSIV